MIEFNDVFDTVKETGDHGSFNSWGRDRYRWLNDVDANTIIEVVYYCLESVKNCRDASHKT